MFPTAVALCNGTSVGTLTDCSPRCTKHNSGIDWDQPKAGLPFISQHFLFSYVFTTKCNPFLLFCPTQLCEGPVFPTAFALCNGTSVGTLTAYTSRCAKHNLEIDWDQTKTGLPFITQHFLFSYAIKTTERPPHWLGVILGYTYRSAETSIFLYICVVGSNCHYFCACCQTLVTIGCLVFNQ